MLNRVKKWQAIDLPQEQLPLNRGSQAKEIYLKYLKQIDYIFPLIDSSTHPPRKQPEKS